jgi:hypothetical protein
VGAQIGGLVHADRRRSSGLVLRACPRPGVRLTGSPDRQSGEREAVLTLSVLVGAISIARAVDDPDLSEQIMANAAAALKQCILN